MTKQRYQPYYRLWPGRFHDLMPFRIREVLLVSSPYDAFILEEDGRLTERLFTDYSELNLSSAPRITHAATGAEALKMLDTRRFDMVITMVRLADMDLLSFARQIKKEQIELPIVLLAFSEAELNQYCGQLVQGVVDLIFIWSGDTRIILAIIKLIEDRLNVSFDTKTSGVQVIIVVEDTIRRYSSFLSLLYSELMAQSHSLHEEGLNDLHRLMRMRARPKILLARTYEEAVEFHEQYRPFLLALISDVRFPRDGVKMADAGFSLARRIRRYDPELPVLLQSAESENKWAAKEMGVLFVDKNSERLMKRIRGFLKESLGFGDFIFRLPNREEVGRARDMYEMEQVLPSIPIESLKFHASHHHFSLWLRARSMFHMAKHLRPQEMGEFDPIEELRTHLLNILRQARELQQEGLITDFKSGRHRPGSRFVRIGSGSIGGKARGLAFVNKQLSRSRLYHRFPDLDIEIPRTVVVGTDPFDRFLEENPQLDSVEPHDDDRQVLKRFIDARIPGDMRHDLRIACQELKGPLAVRSSSLLEDSHYQAFAGIYTTYMLPNNHPVLGIRFEELYRAVKAVYASTFSKRARSYIEGTPFRVEEEKMGVVVQEIVGRRHGQRFYPEISGVALSNNYYPVGPQRSEDGIVQIALGLGQLVMLGGSVLQFSPATPRTLPQFNSASDFLKYSQKEFLALDLGRARLNFMAGSESSLSRFELDKAEEDGTLAPVGSVFIEKEERIRDTLDVPGRRLVTFNRILKKRKIPLAAALGRILDVLRLGMGCPVEVEFAVDLGQGGTSSSGDQKPRLFVVQVRPQAQQALQQEIVTDGFSEEQVFCKTSRSLGHGMIRNIKNVVFVPNSELTAMTTPRVAAELEAINHELRSRNEPYILIGPGRWGTSDPSLGIPVAWSQISGAKVIIETSFEDRVVEPSQGTHFFHNVTSFQVGYLTLAAPRDASNPEMSLDLGWLGRQPSAARGQFVRHIQVDRPMKVFLDGRSGQAMILKPGEE